MNLSLFDEIMKGISNVNSAPKHRPECILWQLIEESAAFGGTTEAGDLIDYKRSRQK